MTAFAAGGDGSEPAPLDARGRAGLAGGQRHHQARGLARQPARARRRRSRHACRAAGARRPRARRRRRLQGCRCRRKRGSPSPRSRAGPSRIASPWSRIASPLSCGCARCRASERQRRHPDAGLSRRARAAPVMRSASTCRRACSRCSTILPPPATPSRTRRKRRAHCSPRCRRAPDDARSRSRNTRRCWRGCRARRSRGCAKPGASRRTIADVRDGAFRFRAKKFGNVHGRAAARSRPRSGTARRLSRSGAAAASCAGRFRALAAARRARSMRSCTWARTARWNGCRARRSR